MSTTMPFTAAPAPVTLWEPRTYPGNLAHLRRLRHDLTRDLAGFDADLVEIVQLCASELLANAAKYTDSGLPGGEILRFLSRPTSDRLRLGFTDAGGSGTVPRIPAERSQQAWDWAEGQRGLVVIAQLSAAWGYHRAAPWADLGTHVWADFALAPGHAPHDPPPYVSPTESYKVVHTMWAGAPTTDRARCPRTRRSVPVRTCDRSSHAERPCVEA